MIFSFKIFKKECALAHSRAKRSRLRHSSSSCECASPARSAFYFIGSSFGISYKTKKAPGFCQMLCKKFQFLPAYIFNAANIIFLISKYYFRLLQYGITQVDLALYLFYSILLSSSNISFLCSYQYLRIIRNIFSLPTGFIV